MSLGDENSGIQEKRIWVIFFIGAFLLLFWNLGTRPFWGAEGRWAEGVREMLSRGDFWVPTINGLPHVTKPLLPYWFIMASAKFFGGLDEWSARLPAALFGFLTLVFFYLLSRRFLDKSLSLLGTALFLTSYGFFYYARLTQSEIYQLVWIVASIAWYVHFRDQVNFFSYLVFWFLVDLAALSKGLTGMAVPCLAVLVDWLINKNTRHLNVKSFLATLIGLAVYFLPYYGTAKALGSDLPFYLIVRENLLQAVSPYDHREPVYVYLIYWPELLLPWSPLLFLALGWGVRKWSNLTQEVKWILASNVAIFLLFTLARCRRSYYILPILPFSVLLMTFYLKFYYARYKKFIWRLVFVFLVLEIMIFAVLQPILSSPSEKYFGQTLARFLKQNPSLRPCAFKKVSANLFFYLNQTRPIPIIKDFSQAQNCDLLFFRERYYHKDPALKGLTVWGVPRKFCSKDPSKNYLLWSPKKDLFVPGLILWDGQTNHGKSQNR